MWEKAEGQQQKLGIVQALSLEITLSDPVLKAEAEKTLMVGTISKVMVAGWSK